MDHLSARVTAQGKEGGGLVFDTKCCCDHLVWSVLGFGQYLCLAEQIKKWQQEQCSSFISSHCWV